MMNIEQLRAAPTGRVRIESRGPIQRPRLVLPALLLLLGGVGPSAFASPADGGIPDLVGEFRFETPSLRMQMLQLRLPDLELGEYSGKDEPDEAEWRVALAQEPADPNLWRLRLEQTDDVVRREVEYLVTVRGNGPGPSTLIPLIASEIAVDVGNGMPLYRAQSIEWAIKDQTTDTEQSVDLASATGWVLGHLNEVFSFDVLDICTDYFGHNPDPRGFERGYGSSIACINRRIELDPQDREAYTLNAWLLWSDWVAWTLDANDIPDCRNNIDLALKMIKKGRAANPDSAAYHLDAAQTLEPLARFHRPELMDFVIRYYLYAEGLAEPGPLQVRIRLNLGHRYRLQGQRDEAIRWYRAVLEIDPENKVARRFLDRLMKVSAPESEGGLRV